MASLLEALPNDVQQNIIERVLPPGDRLDEDELCSLHSLRATSKYMRARIDGDDAYFEKLCKAIWCMKWQPYACDFRFLHREKLLHETDVPVEDWGLIPRGVFERSAFPGDWRFSRRAGSSTATFRNRYPPLGTPTVRWETSRPCQRFTFVRSMD